MLPVPPLPPFRARGAYGQARHRGVGFVRPYLLLVPLFEVIAGMSSSSPGARGRGPGRVPEERCRPGLRFDRLSLTTKRRLLRKYWKREALLCEPWDPEAWSGDDYFR